VAALSAIQHNRRIRSFYDRLVERGKAKKKALVACMRKLLVIPLASVKNQIHWDSEYHASSA
jgi:transposase